MPELPDLQVYLEALECRLARQALERVELLNPFLLRSVQPPLSAFSGRRIDHLRLLGKRICLGFEGGFWLALHLMIAGRLHWNSRGGKPLLKLVFPAGTLSLTEAGKERRASLHACADLQDLLALDAGGQDPISISREDFAALLRRENHTLKRALTDPSILSGIGNAYSDEILHRARLSPLSQTGRLTDEEFDRLHEAVQHTLVEWTERLRAEAAGSFPVKVTAFRQGMAVHGRYREPCPDCGSPVQRIRYAANETDYCAVCQNGGRILADRAMSRLLKEDFPRSL
jgi:formamidopyrimidine-DNA glycosylase